MLKDFRKIWKYFILIFLINFLIINWGRISWIFNYKAISAFFSGVYQGFDKENFIEENFIKESPRQVGNIIEIPKIQVIAPLIFVREENEVSRALKSGVVHWPKSVLPGEVGQTILLGHSAPLNYPKVNYQWVFSQLNDLESNDEIFLYFSSKKYKYLVRKKIFLNKGENLPQFENDNKKKSNVLILISCWPPGKDIRRIAIIGEMVGVLK